MKFSKPVSIVLIAMVLLLSASMPAFAAKPSCVGLYTVSYTTEFLPGDWSPGPHTYYMRITTPGAVPYVIGRTFNADAGAPLHKGQVFLRLGGLMSLDGYVTEINPSQDTVMQLTWLSEPGQSKADLEASAASSTIEFRWDGSAWLILPTEPAERACRFFHNGWFHRHW